jgi:biopolymer transport protein ExbD
MAATVQSKSNDVFADINTTPLIDVMLVLLTLLIITLPMQTNVIKVPQPAPGIVDPVPPVELRIDWDGTLTWEGASVDRATLDAYLARDARQDLPRGIVINADKLAKYDSVALVLADAAHAGETRISFANTEH